MIRKVLLITLLAACSKHGADNTAQCEKTRGQYLKNYDERMTKILAEDTDKQRANDKRDSDIEVANAKEKFVAVCKDTPDFKFDCFDSVAKEDSAECKTFMRDINHRALTSVLGN